jgi:hypothetical protein
VLHGADGLSGLAVTALGQRFIVQVLYDRRSPLTGGGFYDSLSEHLCHFGGIGLSGIRPDAVRLTMDWPGIRDQLDAM